jgi:hypothetical protein
MLLMFFHWVSLYASLLSNLYGEERDEMVAVMDNDDAFDRWLVTFDAKRRKEMGGGKSKGQHSISNDEYLAKFANVYGGDDEGKAVENKQ